MNPNEGALLDEAGIRITRTHLYASEKFFQWNNLEIVRIARQGFFRPRYRLLISTQQNAAVVSIFETKDPQLAKRIEVAIIRSRIK